jgi:hypothetical protein
LDRLVDEVFGPIYYAFGSEDAPECRELAIKILQAIVDTLTDTKEGE